MKNLKALTEESVQSVCESIGHTWTFDLCNACGMALVADQLRGLCTACGRVRSALRRGGPRALMKHIQEGIPPEYAAAELDDFSREFNDRWFTAFSSNLALVLAGPPGVGKTRCAWAVIRRLRAHGFRAELMRAAEYLAALRPDAPQTPKEQANALLTATFACLDDLGAEGKASEWVNAQLQEFLDKRAAGKGCWTLITSNLGPIHFNERYSPAVASRLSGWVLLEVAGADRRVREAV